MPKSSGMTVTVSRWVWVGERGNNLLAWRAGRSRVCGMATDRCIALRALASDLPGIEPRRVYRRPFGLSHAATSISAMAA